MKLPVNMPFPSMDSFQPRFYETYMDRFKLQFGDGYIKAMNRRITEIK